MTLRAVAFDLWETLITNSVEQSRAQEERRLASLAECLESCGRPVPAETLREAHRVIWHHCQGLYWSRDIDIPTRTQILHLIDALGIGQDELSDEVLDDLERRYSDTVLEIPPSLVPFAAETIAWVRERGLRVGLISNTGRTPGSVLRRLLDLIGLGSSIDFAVFSNEEGACKPQRAVFEALSRGLGVLPQEIAFVGDNLEADVAGAKLSGMTAIHFVPQTRGTAVAPTRGDEAHEPHATIYCLSELPPLLSRLP